MLTFSFIFLHLDSTRVALNESLFKYSLFILCWALVEPLSTVHLQFINLLITTNVSSFSSPFTRISFSLPVPYKEVSSAGVLGTHNMLTNLL